MRLAIVIEQLDPLRGGAEVYTSDFLRWLLRAGHPVTVLAAHWSPTLEAECRALGAPVRFEKIDRGGGHRMARAWRFAAGAGSRLAELRAAGEIDVALDMGSGSGCDVIQPHSGVRLEAVHGTVDAIEGAAARALRRVVLRLDPLERARRELQRRRFEAADGPEVIAVSQLVAGCVRRAYGLPEERVHVVHNGVDVERFSEDRLAPLRAGAREELGAGEELVVLTVAHNYRLKGAATVLQLAAWAEEQRLPLRFVIVGGGARQRGPYERRARQLGLNTVRFIPATGEVDRYYAAADLFLLPSFYDSCALTTLEALAAGLPVLTTARNGASELIRPGEIGYVISHARDLAGFQEALGDLLDPQRRARMSAAARSAAQEMSCERNFRRVLEILERVAARRSAS